MGLKSFCYDLLGQHLFIYYHNKIAKHPNFPCCLSCGQCHLCCSSLASLILANLSLDTGIGECPENQCNTELYLPVYSYLQLGMLLPATCRYSPLHATTPSYMLLLPATCHYSQLHAATPSYMPLLPATCRYSPLHATTPSYMPLLTATCRFSQLHAATCEWQHRCEAYTCRSEIFQVYFMFYV